MSPNVANETIFKATTEGKMIDVRKKPGACIDIWPYVSTIQADGRIASAGSRWTSLDMIRGRRKLHNR